MSNASVQVFVTLAGHSKIDFDKKPIKRVLRQEGGQIRKLARRDVARRAVSAPGEMPGRVTGELMRSIQVRAATRGGFWVKVAPYMTKRMEVFYPAFLHHGSVKRNIDKRGNYMAKALEVRRSASQAAILSALKSSLKPR